MSQSKPATPTSSGASSSKPDTGGDLGQAEVQAKFDEAEKQGYFGHAPDETPNENYTLKGVTSGKPTPETERGKK